MKMFLKGLLTLALTSCATSQPAEATGEPVVSQVSIRQIDCGIASGTGFIVAPDVIATARHVVFDRTCYDNETRELITPYEIDLEHDFVLARMETGELPPMPYSCRRFEAGETYVAYGYGMGFEPNPMIATNRRTDQTYEILSRGESRPWAGMRILLGRITFGMSGGPITNIRGVVLGMNNVTNYTYGFSYELADTPLCQNDRP